MSTLGPWLVPFGVACLLISGWIKYLDRREQRRTRDSWRNTLAQYDSQRPAATQRDEISCPATAFERRKRNDG